MGEMIRPPEKTGLLNHLCAAMLRLKEHFWNFVFSMAPKNSPPRSQARASQRRGQKLRSDAQNRSALMCQHLMSLRCPIAPSEGAEIPDGSINVGSNLGFGVSPRVAYEDVYLRSSAVSQNGGTGSVTTHAELGLIVTDFFDYNVVPGSGTVALPVANYFWNVDQNLFENTAAAPILDNEQTFCRVRKLTVDVLPAKGFEIGTGTGPNTNNAQGMFTVQAQVPGVSGARAQSALATNTQVTNVLPQIDTFWKRVLTCNLDQTYKSGVVRPYFDATGVQDSAQCLFQMTVVDPTDGLPYLSLTDDNLVIRVKVSIHVDQPISVIQRASLRVFKNNSFATPSSIQAPATGNTFTPTEAEYVQTDIKSVLNKFR
jgi:hypothetical protein